jgi:hypothetical protein
VFFHISNAMAVARKSAFFLGGNDTFACLCNGNGCPGHGSADSVLAEAGLAAKIVFRKKNGAPGEIRTPDLLVRSRCCTNNQQLSGLGDNLDKAVAMRLLALTVTPKTSRNKPPLGTKLGTLLWGEPLG